MVITRERIVSIVISFFTKQKEYSYYLMAEKIGADQKSIKGWERQERGFIRIASFESIIHSLQDDISVDFEEFSEFFMCELDNDGISKEYTQEVFSKTIDLSVIVEQLLNLDVSKQKLLQEKLGTESIIRNLRKLFAPYRDYFQINEKGICENEIDYAYAPLVHNGKQTVELLCSETEINYLILKFPNSYNIGIVLSNYTIDANNKTQYGYYCYMIEKLRSQNDLKMLLFFTDVDKKDIPFSVQSSLMENYNLFFEFVKKKNLQEVSIHGLEIKEDDAFDMQKLLEQHRYAQVIFERFMSYLSVISDEIIFHPYFEKLHKELDLEGPIKAEDLLNKILVSYNRRTNISNFTNYANQTLIKDICKYSYLSRHTIYHERTLVTELVEGILQEQGKQKLPLAVEICAQNSLTTCGIIKKCERLLLFTASHNAYSLMTKLETKTENRFLPNNVSLLLCHLNPEYMMHQYPNELNGKVDLLVIGYGAGSQIDDLIRFIRYAYNWLSENGVLFISVYNREAIILSKYHIHDQRFESAPLQISDYWTYMLNEQTPLLKKLKTYSLENLQSTYLSLFDTHDVSISTYPYISALINPSEYSRTILDEIREADKLFASKGTHGQIIDVIARKNYSRAIEGTTEGIKSYLDRLNVQYECYTHTLAPDSKSLKRSLQAKNIPLGNTTLLKTVVLQEKFSKEACNKWVYAILPYDKMVAYDHMNYELVPESLVIKRFNQGTISPLTVISKRIEAQKEPMFLLNFECVNTEYVIMGGGKNSESIRIRTKAFRKIIVSENITIQNIIE